jgi:hypothetical protein
MYIAKWIMWLAVFQWDTGKIEYIPFGVHETLEACMTHEYRPKILSIDFSNALNTRLLWCQHERDWQYEYYTR